MSNTTNNNADRPYRFVNECLHIKKGPSEMRILGWDKPTARRRTKLSPIWEDFIPEFQLVRPPKKVKPVNGLLPAEKKSGQLTFDFYGDAVHHNPPQVTGSVREQRQQAMVEFRASLPVNVAEALEQYKCQQWHLLQMFYYDPGSIELAMSNPVLAFFLAQRLDCNVEEIKRLKCSRMRQRDIMRILNYPSTNAAVRMISKVRPDSLTSDNWQRVTHIIGREMKKEKTALSHVSKINVGVLEIVADPAAAAAAGPKLLEQVACDNREKFRGRVVHMIKSALDMQDELEVKRKVTSFGDMTRLYDVHDKVSARYRRKMRRLTSVQVAASAGEFIAPPIPGIPGAIEPITNAEELVDEGELQGNCVASYARKMTTGNLYIYRVMGPQRSTLSIVRNKKGWEIGELEAKFNVAASGETEKIVSAWLKQYQVA